MMKGWKSWAKDLIKNKKVIRFVVYRRMFTPYEQEQKFSDESCYEDVMYNFGLLEDFIALPDGDVLLKFRELNVDSFDNTYHLLGSSNYYKLSEIRMTEAIWDKDLVEKKNEEEDER